MTINKTAQIVSLQLCVEHRQPMKQVDSANVIAGFGIERDNHAASEGPRRFRQIIPPVFLGIYHRWVDADPAWMGSTWIGYGGLSPAQTVNMFDQCGLGRPRLDPKLIGANAEITRYVVGYKPG